MKHLLDNEAFYEQQDAILEQFAAAMSSVQLQDTQGTEQALIKAKISFNAIGNSNDSEELSLLGIMVDFIEISSRFLKGSFYFQDERYKKALEEFTIAKQLCDEAEMGFNRLSPEAIEEFDEDGTFSTLRFLFSFFEHMITVLHGLVQKSMEISDGKYNDEMWMYRLAAAAIRNFDYEHMDTSKISALVVGSVGMLQRMADLYEKKADRIEEKRKIIQYIQPIDSKLFIVHGHDEGILRELKEMLEKNFKITPTILRDEIDIGKTVIEKFEHYGRLAAFTFVIVTPDDLVENKKQKSFQARPNVLFELGWFCGRLGRSNVRIIRKKNTPLPSDLNGIVTVDFNDRLEEVYLKIRTDLEKAGLLKHLASNAKNEV